MVLLAVLGTPRILWVLRKWQYQYARSSDGPEWNGRSEHACMHMVALGSGARAVPQPVVRSY